MSDFEREVMPHVAYLRRIAGRYSRDPDDLVQRTLLRAIEKWHTYRRGGSARSWLISVMVRTAVDDTRRRRRERQILDAFGNEPGPRPPDRDVGDRVRGLRPKHREVAELMLQGYTCKEIADRLGLPLGTVLGRLHDARRVARG